MRWTCLYRFLVGLALVTPLAPNTQADPIDVTVTGSSIFGQVNFSQVLPDGTLDKYLGGVGVGGQFDVGLSSGTISSPIGLTINLRNEASPGSQGATLTLSGMLTGEYGPQMSNGLIVGDDEGGVTGKITAITLSGYDPASQQSLSVSTQASNGSISSGDLAQFSSLTDVPESLLATLTTPSVYQLGGVVSGGLEGIFYLGIGVAPVTGAPVTAPEPTTLALVGLGSAVLYFRRLRAKAPRR